MLSIFVIAVLGAATWYFMTPGDREQFLRFVRRVLGRLKVWVLVTCFSPDPLTDALRERTQWLVVVPSIVVLNVLLFLRMLLSADASGLQEIIASGGNFAPRTGNGEWWRLVTATFVQVSFLSLVVNTGAVLSAGRALERLVGPITFGTVYIAAGMMGALTSLWISAVDVTAGASASVFGVYGLLLACWMWGAFRHSTTTVRLASIRTVAVPALLFVGYNLLNGDLATSAEIAGVATGFLAGLFLTRTAAEQKPSLGRVGGAAIASVLVVFLLSEPVRGVVDPRVEIAAVMSAEKRTAATYDVAVGRFRKGTVRAPELASVIEKKILPDLQAISRRVNSLGRLPMEHQEVMAVARDYLRLREEAWRLRAKALQKASMPMLREASAGEQRALKAYESFSASADAVAAQLAR